MIIEVEFEIHKEYISCPDEVGKEIEKLQNLFFDWLYDVNIDHKYWEFRDDKKYGVRYDADAFIFWLNICHFKKNTVELLVESPEVIEQVKRKIYF